MKNKNFLFLLLKQDFMPEQNGMGNFVSLGPEEESCNSISTRKYCILLFE